MRLVRALALCASCVLPLAAQSSEFVRTGDGWVRVFGGESFAVDPSVVTARFVDGVDDIAAFRAALPPGDVLAQLEVVRWNRLGFVDLRLPSGADPLDVVARLSATGLVALAEVNTMGRYSGVPNDPQFGSQWNLQNVGQAGGTPGADVKAPAAWELSGGSAAIAIGVIDSGTEWSHTDLASNIWANSDEAIDGVDNDGNGYVDDVRGWDFEANDNNPNGGFYHGTAVAGVVAAVGDNGVGIAGLAGGGDAGGGCRVLPCNVGSFFPNSAVLDDAILYAADNGARVITMSLTVPQAAAIDAALVEAHDVLGVFIDCAAGNGFGAPVTYPASHPAVMAVGATNRNDVKSSFSNVGSNLEISAPGEDILMLNLGNGFTTDSGTSFAAPHVAALAGLILSVAPGLTNEAVRTIITSSADDIGAPGFDTQTGWGRIDAAAALALAGGGVIGTVAPYGTGLAGVQGLPLIFPQGGLPQAGNPAFGVELRRGAPNAPAWLVVGFVGPVALPFKGGTLLADPVGPGFLAPLVTSGIGTAPVALPIPVDDQVVGLEIQLQFIVEDAVAVAGYALTGALAVTVGG